MKSAVCIHGAKSTQVVIPRSPRHRLTLVREAAQREGWAYATVRAPGAPGRVVVDSVGGPLVGSTHVHLDSYEGAPAQTETPAAESTDAR